MRGIVSLACRVYRKEHSTMTQATKRFRAVLPDLSDREATLAYLAELEQHQHVRGVPTLILYINKYKETERVLKNQLDQIKRSIDYINGLRYGNVIKAVTEDLDLEQASRAYFSQLTDDVLHWQCGLFFGAKYDTSASREELIEMLVDKQRTFKLLEKQGT
jgi:hypothetical protein